MTRWKVIAFSLLVGTLIALVAYAWLLVVYTVPVLEITAFMAVAIAASIPVWVCWTIVTTPHPSHLPSKENTNYVKLKQEKE
jgi:hypothetical protein